MEGTWKADDLRRAFVAGARWWNFVTTGFTMFASERNEAEDEAERQYPNGKPIYTTAEIEKAEKGDPWAKLLFGILRLTPRPPDRASGPDNSEHSPETRPAGDD